MIASARAHLAAVPRRERRVVLALMALGAVAVVAYALIVHPLELRGDMIEYDSEGAFFAAGKPWWTTLPFGIAHEGMWKAPLYPAWVGFAYELFGRSPEAVAILQGLIFAPLAVGLTWLLGRRQFGPAVGIAAAAVIALVPLVWEYFGLLYSEALAIPLTLAALILILERPRTAGRAAAIGALIGVGILVRPTSGFLLAGAAAAFVVAAGWRRGIGLAALAAALALLVVAPWTIRNYAVADALIPVSIQDAAIYGTFNEESASDPEFPYAWRAVLRDQPDVLTGPPVSDARLRTELQDEAFDYIRDHPESLAGAFFWNGIVRFWDLRRPTHSTLEAPFEGRSTTFAWIRVLAHYLILALALAGLWAARRRRELVIPVLASALAASIVFTAVSGTRYRAPVEPLVVVLAASFVVPRAVALRRKDGSLVASAR